jgi:hypothetical protein
MPDGSEGPDAGSVIMVTPEDDINATVAYRLRAAKAELGRINDLTTTESGAPFELPDSLPAVRELIDDLGDVRMVIVDPLMAASSVSLASNITARRRIMAPLQRLAKETGVAVVVSHHLVKSGSVAGSRGLTDAARIVHKVARDQENPRVRVFSVDKINIGADDAAPLRYVVAGEWPDTCVTWLWRAEDDAPGAPMGASQARVLLALRAAQGPMSAQDLAQSTGVAYGVVRVALVKLTRRGLVAKTERGRYAPVSVAA